MCIITAIFEYPECRTVASLDATPRCVGVVGVADVPGAELAHVDSTTAGVNRDLCIFVLFGNVAIARKRITTNRPVVCTIITANCRVGVLRQLGNVGTCNTEFAVDLADIAAGAVPFF